MGLFIGFVLVETARPLSDSWPSADRHPAGQLHTALRASSFNSLDESVKIKKAACGDPFYLYWWRRRELNPRPSALCLPIYMLRHFFKLTLSLAEGQAAWGESIWI